MSKLYGTIFAAVVALSAAGVTPAPSARMDRSKLLIGAYCLQANARTDAHVKAIHDCGVDFIVGVPADRAMLDLFAKHGVGAIVNGVVPGWWGGRGNNGKLREVNPPEKYAECIAAFRDHPAIWAIDIGDEPSALDFPYYGEVVRQINKALPGMPLYLNLYPNYASVAQNTGNQTVSQLGTKTYAGYIEAYCREVPLDYISYDFYPYLSSQGWTDSFLSKMYDNFLVVADACRRTKKAFWYIPQVNSRDGMSPTSENRLRFQANAALSFGAEAITWACWGKGWWTNNVLDAAGQQTEQYAKLQCVNAELKRLGPQYMRFRNVATRLVGFAARAPYRPKRPVNGAPDDAGYPHASNGAALIVGEMAARDPSGTACAYFVTAADDPCDAHPASFELVFSSKGKKVAAFGGQGSIPVTRSADGLYSVPISSCGGVLLVME